MATLRRGITNRLNRRGSKGAAPRAPRGEINIVFLMPGIIVRVELYRGLSAALLGFSLRGRLVPAALTLVPSMIDQLFPTEERN